MHRIATLVLLALALFFASTTAYVWFTRPAADPCGPNEVGTWSLDRHAHDLCLPSSIVRIRPVYLGTPYGGCDEQYQPGNRRLLVCADGH